MFGGLAVLGERRDHLDRIVNRFQAAAVLQHERRLKVVRPHSRLTRERRGRRHRPFRSPIRV
jgi:hypothetical protein